MSTNCAAVSSNLNLNLKAFEFDPLLDLKNKIIKSVLNTLFQIVEVNDAVYSIVSKNVDPSIYPKKKKI